MRLDTRSTALLERRERAEALLRRADVSAGLRGHNSTALECLERRSGARGLFPLRQLSAESARRGCLGDCDHGLNVVDDDNPPFASGGFSDFLMTTALFPDQAAELYALIVGLKLVFNH